MRQFQLQLLKLPHLDEETRTLLENEKIFEIGKCSGERVGKELRFSHHQQIEPSMYLPPLEHIEIAGVVVIQGMINKNS